MVQKDCIEKLEEWQSCFDEEVLKQEEFFDWF
jgi:hypothetical protein